MIGSVAEKVGEFFGRLVKMRDGLEELRNGFKRFLERQSITWTLNSH